MVEEEGVGIKLVALWAAAFDRAALRAISMSPGADTHSCFPCLLQAAEADEQLVPLERRLTVDEILTCRHVAQRVLDASLAAASGMGEAMLVGGGG